MDPNESRSALVARSYLQIFNMWQLKFQWPWFFIWSKWHWFKVFKSVLFIFNKNKNKQKETTLIETTPVFSSSSLRSEIHHQHHLSLEQPNKQTPLLLFFAAAKLFKIIRHFTKTEYPLRVMMDWRRFLRPS
jgi:hypothetical protein